MIYGDGSLCWQQGVKPESAMDWEDANDYCNNLILGVKKIGNFQHLKSWQ